VQSHGVKTLGVVGAGQMGGGIAQVASQVAGVQVVIVDSQQAQLERALKLMGAPPTPRARPQMLQARA